MRRIFSFNRPTLLLSFVFPFLGFVLLWLFYLSIAGQVHAAAPITPSGLNTQVSAPIVTGSGATQTTQYNITGGTRPGGGANLFHSFGDFSVPTNNIANFYNESGPGISNILGRVTGGNISNIFGTIQTTNFGNANLFLMNPAGFLFGPKATLNVGGMVAFTSADYLRLGDGKLFNAIPNAGADALLSAAPVAAFGFLGSNPGAITVKGSQFTVTPGTGISLVGGNITVQSGTLSDGTTVQPAHLSAPGGQINLASVASPGEILTGTLAQASNINGQSFGNLGTIQVSEQSAIDVRGNGGGTVSIRGGQFVLDNSTISANTTGPGPVTNGAEAIGGGIDIQVSQDAVIQNLGVLETNVTGNATPGVTYGGVHVEADRIEILGTVTLDDVFAGTGDLSAFTGIRSDVRPGSTGGNSGAITLDANSILINNWAQLETITESVGNAGNIIFRANQNLDFDFGQVSSSSGTPFSVAQATGDAGSIELTSAHGNISLTNLSSIGSQTVGSPGTAGTITLSAPSGNILVSDFSGVGTLITPPLDLTGEPAVRAGGSGGVLIDANNLQLINGGGIAIVNLSNLPPGNITVNLSGSLTLRGGDFGSSTIQAASQGPAPSAGLNITAHDILITDGSSLTTSTLTSGAAGPLNISAVNLQLTNGGRINSGSQQGIDPFTGLPGGPPPSGPGGTVTIQGLSSPAQSVLIDGQGSGILTNTVGTGAGGNINILANNVTLQNGGTLSAATSGTATPATGGSIIVNATDRVTMAGGASITASSTGPADAGNISSNAGQLLEMQNSSITTRATHASGGNIDIQAVDLVRLGNSTISASVEGGPTTAGGNITIDPNSVILQNSQITAEAVQGAGGNISITTNLLLPDANSVISASSQFGAHGNITIQSPNAPASGKIQPLGKSPLLATTLLNQRCAALAGGEFSSFTVAGRDSLPAEPGSWLASPLALASENTAGTVIQRGTQLSQSEPAKETPVLSLRQIAPAGFLTQAFAVDWSAGCQS